MGKKVDIVNREISWLQFNDRVLQEAVDKGNPLLERLKFLAIVASNLDEFFMVRVAGIRKQVEDVSNRKSLGYDPEKLLDEMITKIKSSMRSSYKILAEQVLTELKGYGIVFTNYAMLSSKVKVTLDSFFHEQIFPILTPIGVDSSHPFPLLKNCSLQVLVRLIREDETTPSYGLVEVPSIIDRYVEVTMESGARGFVAVEDLIVQHTHDLFEGCTILECSMFRITRDMHYSLDEESIRDLMSTMQDEIKQRVRRRAIRLEVTDQMTAASLEWLQGQVNLTDQFTITQPANLPINLKTLFEVYGKCYQPELVDEKLPHLESPYISEGQSVFDAIKQNGPFLLHHPFESFDPIIRLVEEAAEDPQVLTIKQTLYRVSGNSPIIKALMRAAENGKQVTVLVELKARFDEANNIQWAQKLAEAGAHVVYGIAGFKVHCKTLLIIRREPQGIRRYVHIGTGNYNDSTAKLYTDLGMMTDDQSIAADVSALYNVLSGYSRPPKWSKLIVAPFNFRSRMKYMFDREMKASSAENPGLIRLKSNSCIDPGIVAMIYKAAENNVQVEMTIRGINGIKMSALSPKARKNIKVVSILDRYLEHTRLYYFKNNGAHEYYIGSGDLMPRNIDRRIEVLTPVEDPKLAKELHYILDVGIKDTRKGRVLKEDNTFSLPKVKDEKARSQIKLADYYSKRLKKARKEQEAEMMKVFEAD